MSLYNGVALFQEKQAVVLDLGTEYTKFGFTGEPAPRCIIRSQFWSETERRYRRVYDYSSPEELYENLVNMLHLLYFRHVLVNPKERKVVVVESLLTPTEFRETLAKVLFTHYEVSGVVWADTGRLCALTLAAPVALVVSLGAREAEVTPVVHGCVVLRALQTAPLGAHALHQELARMIDEDNGRKMNLSDHVIEDIKVKTCFVIDRSRAQLWATSPPTPAKDVNYPIEGGETVLVKGRTRELATELMFVKDGEMMSLPDIMLAAVVNSPIDARRELCANILLWGGGANLPGLQYRLAEELRELQLEQPYAERVGGAAFRFHVAPAQASCVAWAGGALCGAAAAARAHPRELYARERRLRDWSCLLDNTPPDHPARTLTLTDA